ncbi:MAG TPA: NlpC/P60 family protein [Pseudonocardia sp.]|nr:NlpC/P60 family protein [Pseudonocardia sp.]
MPHHPEAFWTGATVSAKPTLRAGALAKATAATATVAALLSAGSADFPASGPLAHPGYLSLPAVHLALPHLPTAPIATPAPAAIPAALAGPAASVAALAASPLSPDHPLQLRAALAAIQPAAPVPAVAPPAPAAPPVKIAPPPTTGARALAAALTAKGTPYVWGGTRPGGFDCSGLMLWSFKRAGLTLPRTAAAQSVVGQPVSLANLQPGDLVFFYSPVSHVGIYVGNGQVLNAPQTGDVVKLSPIARMPFHNARRIV